MQTCTRSNTNATHTVKEYLQRTRWKSEKSAVKLTEVPLPGRGSGDSSVLGAYFVCLHAPNVHQGGENSQSSPEG